MQKLFTFISRNNIMVEIVLSLLISWGGFSQIIPNLLTSVSEVNEYSSFKSLTMFSMVYFLLSIVVITSYWLMRGWRLYLAEKLNAMKAKEENQKYEMHITDGKVNKLEITKGEKREEGNFNLKKIEKEYKASFKLEIFSLIVILFKISPFILYLYDPYCLYRSWVIYLLLGLSVVIIVAQAILIQRKSSSYLNHIAQYNNQGNQNSNPESQEKETQKPNYLLNEENEKNLLNRALRIAFLIFLMDFILMVGFIYFGKPWNLYNSTLHFLINIPVWALSFIAFFGLKFFGFSDNAYTKSNMLLGLALLLFLIIIFPNVNQDKFCLIKWINTFIIGGILIFNYFNLGNQKIKSIYIGIGGILLLLFAWFSFPSTMEKLNFKYLENRVNASHSISTEKLFPFYMDISNGKNGKIDDKVKEILAIHKFNHYYRVHKTVNDSVTKTQFQEIADFEKKLDTQNTRKFYFKTYDIEFSEISDSLVHKLSAFKYNPGKIDSFYKELYKHIETSIFEGKLHKINKLIKGKEEKIKDETRNILKDLFPLYDHPVGYYSNVMLHYRDQLNYSEELNRQTAEVVAISKLKNRNYLYESTVENKLNRIVEDKIVPLYKNIIEFQNSMANIKPDTILKSLDEIKSFNEDFYEYKKVQYNDRLDRAQTIFLSYLTDVQRIGLWLLLAQLILIFYAFILNQLDLDDFKQDKSSEKSIYIDVPRYSLLLGLLVTLLLFLPLARTIKKENINPEDKYWMLHTYNWYTPKIIRSIISPMSAESTPSGNVIRDSKSSSRNDLSSLENKLNNTYLNLDKVITKVDGIVTELIKTNSKTDSILTKVDNIKKALNGNTVINSKLTLIENKLNENIDWSNDFKASIKKLKVDENRNIKIGDFLLSHENALPKNIDKLNK